MRRDARGRFLPSPARTLAKQLKQIALLRSHPNLMQRFDGEWRWLHYWVEDAAA